MSANEIKIILRVPDGSEFDAMVPLNSTGDEIVESMFDAEAIPRVGGDGKTIEYDLVSHRSNRTIGRESLQNCAVVSGEVLSVVPKHVPPPVSTASGEVSLVIRIMPKGDEFDADLPLDTRGSEIIQRILDDDFAPRFNPEGDPYEYELVSKRTNRSIEDQRLGDCDISSGDTLYVVPKMVAGFIKQV